MGEVIGFVIDLSKKAVKLWAKITGEIITLATKLFGQGVKATARNAKSCAKNKAAFAKEAVCPASKNVAIGAAAVACLAALIYIGGKEK